MAVSQGCASDNDFTNEQNDDRYKKAVGLHYGKRRCFVSSRLRVHSFVHLFIY